ncbi:arginine deiminase family protein [Haladaptatus halobius]|uniref:arginine deiminase family protein n=1 Tax=Haladaptatus halobius TaxID=2884875 RepID=UPI001D0A7359|nr:arginine deiminase family protein [Haladaptatus halobius]
MGSSLDTVYAEWDRLSTVRVHTPGIEVWAGTLDYETNLFEQMIPPERARAEHEKIISCLKDTCVEVHQLADDLETAGVLDDLIRESISEIDANSSADVEIIIETFNSREKLHLALAQVSMRQPKEEISSTSLTIDQPLSNMYFQRDTTILGDKGPILCNMFEPVRQREVPIVRDAWEGIGADIIYEMDMHVEGGEFLPAGEFALLGVSANLDGKEHVIRTSYAAGQELMDSGAIEYDEFVLVRAPLQADREFRKEHDTGSRIMHLLGWVNIVAEDLIVLDADLARAANVDVYERHGDEYAKEHSSNLYDYLAEEKGFEIVDVSWSERWPTNFLTIESETILPLYEPDANGEYRSENNPTIEKLKELGVEILPDGAGIPRDALTNGGGGIHCMTTPLSRE